MIVESGGFAYFFTVYGVLESVSVFLLLCKPFLLVPSKYPLYSVFLFDIILRQVY